MMLYQQVVLALTALGCSLLAFDVSAQSRRRETIFEMNGASKLTYKQVDDVSLALHVFFPEGWQERDTRAAIVFFFGGGWNGGTPAQFQPQCEHLAARGMVAITAEYRVRSRHGVAPSDCVADAKDAVRWVRSHADELGIDRARIAVSGGSAGGHVALSTATLGRLPEEDETAVSCQPNALVLYNPVCDTSPLGYGGKRLGNRMYELSPVHHLPKGMPPTLVFHGEADTTVPLENVKRLQRLMREAGNACELVAYPEAVHGFFNRGRKHSQYDDTTKRLDDFLTRLGFLLPRRADVAVAGRTLEQWTSEFRVGSPTRRLRAARSLGQFGPLAAEQFQAMLRDEDAAIRYVGASHVGDHQTPAAARTVLRTLVAGESRGVSAAAAYALCRLGDTSVGLPVLRELISLEERGIVCSAADFIGRLGPAGLPLAEAMEAEMARKKDYHEQGALRNAIRGVRHDTSLTQHRRPTGGGTPRGWQPSGQASDDEARTDPRPNILWISCEDISPNLGCYGDTYARTPNLDALAREGARFDRAFTPAGVCAVMRSGHITGVYPISQGSHHMRSNIVLPTGVRCFPEYLRAAGYFCTNKSKTDYQFAVPKSVWDRQGNNHADWRERASGQPFFSVINLTCSHESQIRHGERTHAAVLDRLSADQRHDPNVAGRYLPPIYPDTPEARKDWAWYADNISEMDRQAGLILQQLEEDGLANNTIVVFWSDHGRGLPRGKRWIYDSGVHVPMIVRWPGHVQPGTSRGDLVSTQDLAPTMLSLAGVSVPSHMQGRVFLGEGCQPEPDFLFFHRDRMDEAYELMRAARDHRFKYIRNYSVRRTYAQNIDYMNKMPTLVDLRRFAAEGRLNTAQYHFLRQRKPPEELYDLELDPHETVNLAALPEQQERLRRMRGALERWQDEIEDLGMVPEPVLMERMRPGDELQVVRTPIAEVNKQQDGTYELKLATETEGASICYRFQQEEARPSPWQLYSGPVTLNVGANVEICACRAGFRDSPVELVNASP